MNPETMPALESMTEGGLRLFSLYLDFNASVRARWGTSQIARLAGEHWTATTEMWNLDSLAAGEPIRKLITQEAADADVLIVAMSSIDRRELELVQWLDSVAAFKKSRPVSGLFVGLLGDENSRPGELDWTIKQFLGCARRLDRDFIWRWMDHEAMDSNDWLGESVATLLTRKQSAPEAIFWPGTALGAA
ncbi:MAG TPA: hypothetical protein VMB80_17870 [Candidatus Acidoferrum sp.]|nr:hypothetical protein [Candidatus Acidoferrum sp.]